MTSSHQLTRKVLLDVDPGIADALAMCLALSDPQLEVVAVTSTGGNVPPEQATRNVQAIIEQLDPARWPRIGAADPLQPLRTDGRSLCGNDGLCGADFRVAELHHQHSSVKVIAEEIRAAPGELTIIAGGPLSNLATVFQREPDLAPLVGHLIVVGGTYNGPGNVTAAAEFNMYCDAEAARCVLSSPVTKTLLPLDVSSSVELDVGVLDQFSGATSGAGRLLREILPGAFRAYRQQLGVEAISVPEAVAIVAMWSPELLTTEPLFCQVETTGALTHGATVLDRRRVSSHQPNMDVVTRLDARAVLDRLLAGLRSA
jgi:purine nucleosidase